MKEQMTPEEQEFIRQAEQDGAALEMNALFNDGRNGWVKHRGDLEFDKFEYRIVAGPAIEWDDILPGELMINDILYRRASE